MSIGYDHLITINATVDDTLDLIQEYVHNGSKDAFVKQVVEQLGPVTDREDFIKRVFDYYCRNVPYIPDPKGKETVYTPARTIDEGGGDCKKASVFIASVLTAAGIPCVLKHVYYGPNDLYTHIYVIVPNPDLSNYITLDPPNDCKYDTEVSHSAATLYFLNGEKMELHGMGYAKGSSNDMSIGHACDDLMSGIGSTVPALAYSQSIYKSPQAATIMNNLASGQDIHTAVVTAVAPTPGLVNSVSDIPLDKQRGAFLALVAANVNNVAVMLANVLAKDPSALNNMWAVFGGDINVLKQTIINGVTNPTQPSISGLFDDFMSGLASAANVITNVAGPIVNAVIPGAGLVMAGINTIIQKTTNPPKPTPAQIAKLPADPTGTLVNIPAPNRLAPTASSVTGSAFGFVFKTLLLINMPKSPLHIENHMMCGIAGLTVIVSALIYSLLKK